MNKKLGNRNLKISILGTVGVPGKYGGFETLAENLVRYHSKNNLTYRLSVYCSSKFYPDKEAYFLNTELRYLGLQANGWQSVAYDLYSIIDSLRKRDDVVLLLGVSGALAIPLLRIFSRIKVVTNIDGIEWKRKKWSGLSKCFLKWSEWAAVKFSHAVVSDNDGITQYVKERYKSECVTIPYGGDNALLESSKNNNFGFLPKQYALALCRIEPENNIDMILEGWKDVGIPLVFVGNWQHSVYSRELKEKYKNVNNLILLDPVYDPSDLRYIRENATVYIHGHSAGGTNPSLVEMMHFSLPILAYDCVFNRETTENSAEYFTSASSLSCKATSLINFPNALAGVNMKEIALRRYTWNIIGGQYFDLIVNVASNSHEDFS